MYSIILLGGYGFAYKVLRFFKDYFDYWSFSPSQHKTNPYINKNYIKIDNYKTLLFYVDELYYNIGDRLEVIVDEYDVIEVVGLHVEPEPEFEDV